MRGGGLRLEARIPGLRPDVPVSPCYTRRSRGTGSAPLSKALTQARFSHDRCHPRARNPTRGLAVVVVCTESVSVSFSDCLSSLDFGNFLCSRFVCSFSIVGISALGWAFLLLPRLTFLGSIPQLKTPRSLTGSLSRVLQRKHLTNYPQILLEF